MKVKENLHQENSNDVYDMIRSSEVREYYKNNVNLTIYEKEQIILHSYISIQQKVAIIKKLMDEANENDKPYIEHLINEIYRRYLSSIYKNCILVEIGYV